MQIDTFRCFMNVVPIILILLVAIIVACIYEGTRKRSKKKMEHERKFLIDRFPTELCLLNTSVLYTGYFDNEPELLIAVFYNRGYRIVFQSNIGRVVIEDHGANLIADTYKNISEILKHPYEARIRKKEYAAGRLTAASYKLCFKSKGNISRKEEEIDLESQEFEAISELITHPFIEKQFSAYKLGTHTLECNAVDPSLPSAFMYAEIEFKSMLRALFFRAPTFLHKDVTFKRYYKMYNYWCRTRLTNHD